MSTKSRLFITWLFLFLLGVTSGYSQKKKSKNTSVPSPVTAYNLDLIKSVEYRSIGPFRGGRSCAVSGVEGHPNLFYFGSTGGGIWRTKDGGSNWENISDGFFGGSIGSVAVAPSDPNVLYVGGGEKTVRGNVSYGYGIWKSVDAGRTWTFSGLPKSRHIPRIRVHPKNPDIVFAAVLGDLFKSSDKRGIYKSIDGGQTWKKVLFANEDAGAVDLLFDPSNPRILYASTWNIRRTPYSLSSGGAGSNIWKSTDNGETWESLSENKGFPKGPLGIIGIAVSPVNPDRVWAMTEAKEGGLFRSDDGGKTWNRINKERKLRQRAWYYTRVYASPHDADVVYVLNVRFHKSKDGGKSFQSIGTPHGDHHDLWIAPEDPERMIVGDDGGAQITFDGGTNWSTYQNQPTAQFYRVTTDNHFPYRIYAAQQDNSTVRIAHRTNGGSIGTRDWEPTAGGESAHLAPKPDDPEIVFGGSYDGYLTTYNHRTKQRRAVNVWPDNPMGHGVVGMRYRFQWNFPIFFSPHDPNVLYTTSNHVHRSTDGGEHWEIISPDLTRNDTTKMGSSGGPITQDNTSVEYYCTIFAAAESPREKGVLWTGSDDGLVYLSRDTGKNWSNVTPPQLPEWSMINSLEVDPHQDGGCYLTVTRYKLGDYQPMLYKTNDYGKTWTAINKGIDPGHFTRVIRADPTRKGLLYAGTESGMYISFDDGANWQEFQLNLPIVPITDLAIKENNLIVATQGRSLWIIDDLGPIRQLKATHDAQDFILFQPKDTYRMSGWYNKKVRNAGVNHPNGVMVYFHVPELEDTAQVTLEFFDPTGKSIRKFDRKAKERSDKLQVESGSNLFIWNMQYPGAERFDGMILWWASLSGPSAVPGEYSLTLTVDGQSLSEPFTILKDPRSEVSQADMQAQFDFLLSIRDKVTEVHEGIQDRKRLTQRLTING
ncbi:MAG: glycosyl hydrolase [Bacteroidota bacterium]